MDAEDNTSSQLAEKKNKWNEIAPTKANSNQIDFELKPQTVQNVIRAHPKFYQSMNTFDFNLFQFTETVGRNMQMPFMATALIQHNDLMKVINYDKFLAFIVQIYNKYQRSVEYHNDLHGCDVAQHCHFILKTQGLARIAQFNDMDVLAILVAALCHDVKHDGFNNKYHVVTKSQRYQMYGEASVQESYHAAETLRLLNNNEYDFFSEKSQGGQNDSQLFQKRMLESIISTDMALMKQLRGQLADHLQTFKIENGQNTEMLIDTTSQSTIEQSKQLISNGLIHACDISTSLRDFEVSVQWAELLYEEFFSQGDIEKAQGLEISALCDRETTKIAGGQAGFIQFVVMPIFHTLSQVVPEIQDLQIASGNQNLEKWDVRAEAEKKQIEKEQKMKQLISQASKLKTQQDKSKDTIDLSEKRIEQQKMEMDQLLNAQKD